VMQEVRERAHAISEMANTLGATLDYNKVLEAAMNIGALAMKEGTQNTRLTGMVLIFEKDQMRIATSRRLTTRDQTKLVPARSGVLGQALEQAEPVFAGRCNDDPELGYFVAFQDTQSVLVIPLRAGFANYGLLVFGSTEANAFLPEHAELLSAIGTQATVALQNAVLYQNLRDEKERIVKVEEDARKKLARDLHDGPTQTISAVAMRINYIRKMLEKDPATADPELEKAEDLARQATKEIRNMLFNLRPLVLESQGLCAALEQFRQKMKDTYELNVARVSINCWEARHRASCSTSLKKRSIMPASTPRRTSFLFPCSSRTILCSPGYRMMALGLTWRRSIPATINAAAWVWSICTSALN
jgi:signal transduction histidine kinase